MDAWFDGAGDNADGLAVMLALARHFARPEHQPDRTLVFIASAGHHSPGLNGPRAFMDANPGSGARRGVLLLNIEHVAQRNFSPPARRDRCGNGYRQAIADSGEAPIYAGVSPIVHRFSTVSCNKGVLRYGANFVSDRSNMESGETGGFSALKTARVTIMQAPPLYHTTGEVKATSSLHRASSAWPDSSCNFVKESDKVAGIADQSLSLRCAVARVSSNAADGTANCALLDRCAKIARPR